MIKQIFTAEEFSQLPEKGVEAQKIRALYKAYGSGYDFCRFYRQEGSFISVLDGSCVLCTDGSTDLEELADFFCMTGYTDVFCPCSVGERLAGVLSAQSCAVNLMRFGGSLNCVAEFDSSPSLDLVYSIISEGFDIAFEPWYLDMSHRVRHGVTQCCVSGDSAALVVQHNIHGEAMISQVACRKNARGKGIATELVAAVSAWLSPSEVYVICEDKLLPFYERCGFIPVGKNTVICR